MWTPSSSTTGRAPLMQVAACLSMSRHSTLLFQLHDEIVNTGRQPRLVCKLPFVCIRQNMD